MSVFYSLFWCCGVRNLQMQLYVQMVHMLPETLVPLHLMDHMLAVIVRRSHLMDHMLAVVVQHWLPTART